MRHKGVGQTGAPFPRGEGQDGGNGDRMRQLALNRITLRLIGHRMGAMCSIQFRHHLIAQGQFD